MSTEVLVKKDLILGGLTCAHCAEEIGKGVRKIDGIVDSNMNFVNKKLTVLFDSAYNEEEVIKAIIKKIDSIETGLDIQVVEKRNDIRWLNMCSLRRRNRKCNIKDGRRKK